MTHSPQDPLDLEILVRMHPGVEVRQGRHDRDFWELTSTSSVGAVTLRNGLLSGYRETPAFHCDPVHLPPTHRAHELLTGVVFAVDLQAQAPVLYWHESHHTEYHIYRKCPRSIEPLLGAPAIPWAQAKNLRVTPLSKDDSCSIVVGATLECPNVSEHGVVVHVEPSGQAAWVKLPSKPFPIYGAIASSNAFTGPTSFLPYNDMTAWRRDPDVALHYNTPGNCPVLRPGDLTSHGRVLWVSPNSVRLHSFGITADCAYLETPCGAVFLDVGASESPPVAMLTSCNGFTSAPKLGELWKTLTDQFVAITVDERGVVIPQPNMHSEAEVLDFWIAQSRGTRSAIHVSCSEYVGNYYPRAVDPSNLLVSRVSEAGFWYLSSRYDAPVGIVPTDAPVVTRTWRGLPLDPYLFLMSSRVPSVHPALPNSGTTQIPAPEPEDEETEDPFTCYNCSDEDCRASESTHVRLFRDSPRSSHATICSSCYAQDSAICPGCNLGYISLDADGYALHASQCPSCVLATQVAQEAALPTLYRGYSYRPEPKFLGAGPLYFGVELELWTDSQKSMQRMAKDVHENTHPVIYSKTDSSIGEHGLEFVTHPFTLDSVAAESALATLFTLVDKPNWKATDNCGIHIHTSKLGYKILESSLPSDRTGYLTHAQLLTRGLFRAQKFVYGNPRLITYFAGRDSDKYASLDIRPGEDQERNGDDGYTGFEDALRLCWEHRADKPNRYAAMNFTKDTVEYRVFKSTKDYGDLLRNLHFIESIVQYARHHAMPKTRAPSLKPYREFLETQASWDDVRKYFDAGLGAKFN